MAKFLESSISLGFAYTKVLFEKDKKSAECFFIEVNPAFEKIVGISSEKIIGKKLSEIFPDFAPLWFESLKTLSGKEIKKGEALLWL